MGDRGYEGNHLYKLLTSSDKTRKKPMNLNMAFLDVLSLEYLCLRSRSKFLHNRSGGLSLSNDQFDLTESNVSNAIYTPGPCLRQRQTSDHRFHAISTLISAASPDENG